MNFIRKILKESILISVTILGLQISLIVTLLYGLIYCSFTNSLLNLPITEKKKCTETILTETVLSSETDDIIKPIEPTNPEEMYGRLPKGVVEIIGPTKTLKGVTKARKEYRYNYSESDQEDEQESTEETGNSQQESFSRISA